jgi:hypothetical protein
VNAFVPHGVAHERISVAASYAQVNKRVGEAVVLFPAGPNMFGHSFQALKKHTCASISNLTNISVLKPIVFDNGKLVIMKINGTLSANLDGTLSS